MAAIDKLMLAAKRPDCLLALFPHDGGTILSHMRGSVMPSSTPRNFATEPATYAASWHDFQAIGVEKIGIDDFEREINYERFGTNIMQLVSYPISGRGILGIYASAYGSALTLLFNAYASQKNTVTTDAIETRMRNIIRFTRIGSIAEIYFNDLLVRRIVPVSGSPTQPFYFDQPVQSSFNGYFQVDYLKNISTNQIVWQYPTWSEKVRLITKANVRTDRLIFEAANPSLSWSIKTPLVTGMTGTVISIKNGTISINGAEWNRMTGVMSGLAQDKITALLVFDRILSTDEISAIT